MRFLQQCRSQRCRKFFGILPEMLTGGMSKRIKCPHCGHANQITLMTKQKYRLMM
ncbi:MAG: hypothetical protein PHH00_02855 [Candidatus Nanoarchaeia archaeon]|nr:hypothetical protein [Candidatus Nanoarchaeia archaeon]